MAISFKKMHGLGNDFVIVPGVAGGFTVDQVRAIADRRRGVGCDQFIVMEPVPDGDAAHFFMRIYNPDGSEAGACGNATRCVAHLWMTGNGKNSCTIRTVSGLLECTLADRDMVKVDMGPARLNWDEIPLREERDTAALELRGLLVDDGTAVSMGNPHCVFFVENIEGFPVADIGPLVENHSLFPQRTNVEFAQVRDEQTIRMRVWERGAGITEACGSGACATLVAAVRRGLIKGRAAEIVLDGGSLFVEWRESDGHVMMTGPVAYVFEGVLP